MQLLAAEERLEGDTLLLGYLLLDAAGCATPAAALHVQVPRSWWIRHGRAATFAPRSPSLPPLSLHTRPPTHPYTHRLTCPGVVVV